MTEAEIMKALEWCELFTDNIVLSNKKGEKFTFALQSLQTIKQVLKDYNRKNAEIEKLEKSRAEQKEAALRKAKELDESQIELSNLKFTLMCGTTRAEAIKEVLEKAKRKAFNLDLHRCMCVYVEDLDQIAKEMGVEL